jgi:hypothetical protein
MAQASLSALTGWVTFYEIVGSAAGALTGLQFVVITLVSNAQATGSMREIRAFGTPTVVHFCAALLMSAIMSTPWHSFSHLGACVGTCAVAGLCYSLSVIFHARKADYTPDTEDWVWYVALPVTTYTVLVAAAVLLWWRPELSLFLIAAVSVLFLFIGIHNAWDTVTYIAIQRHKKSEDTERS